MVMPPERAGSSGRIPVAGPWITELEAGYVADALATNWYEHAGDYIARFEQGFAAHAGRRHAVSLPSCTAGLHLALAALGIGPGDEVVVPDITWIASAAPVSYVGATPVFVDIDPDTWCIRPDSVAGALSPRTRAIIAVDLYGAMCDFDALRALAEPSGIAVIEDAAEAIGGAIGTRAAGSFGVASVFSFHGSKTLTTGEGGMLVTDDDALVERVRRLRDHGRPPGSTDFRNDEIGFKYKMSSLQAALGLAQLERVDELVARKREIFGWYRERLGGLEGLRLNVELNGTTNAYWMPTVILDPALRLGKERLRAELGAEGIDTRPIFDPLSLLPAYAGTVTARGASVNQVAREIAPHGVNLPSPLNLTEAQADRVCEQVRASIQRAQARLRR
jgi:perosamine synthetase